jgi:hypothetical protein
MLPAIAARAPLESSFGVPAAFVMAVYEYQYLLELSYATSFHVTLNCTGASSMKYERARCEAQTSHV